MKRIVIVRQSGRISIMHLQPETVEEDVPVTFEMPMEQEDGSVVMMPVETIERRTRLVEPVVAAHLERWRVTAPEPDVAVHELPNGVTLPDNDFFDAFRWDGESVVVDMPAARDVWRERLRSDRRPLLADADLAFMRALEAGNDAARAAAVARKQALRDLPQRPEIEAAATTAELKALTIDTLLQS